MKRFPDREAIFLILLSAPTVTGIMTLWKIIVTSPSKASYFLEDGNLKTGRITKQTVFLYLKLTHLELLSCLL